MLSMYLMGVRLTVYASQERVSYRRTFLTGLSRERVSHIHASHRRASITGLHLIGVYLLGVPLLQACISLRRASLTVRF